MKTEHATRCTKLHAQRLTDAIEQHANWIEYNDEQIAAGKPQLVSAHDLDESEHEIRRLLGVMHARLEHTTRLR